MIELQEILNNHHDEYQKFQWALMNSIGSLIYSEFISKFKKYTRPVPHIEIPSIKYIEEMLNKDGDFLCSVREKMVSYILDSNYKEINESEIFKLENREDLNKVIELYLIPNVIRFIPDVIRKKFNLNENQSFFREFNNIDLFDRKFNQEWIIDYVLEEIVLQYVAFFKAKVSITQTEFVMGNNNVISIDNKNAICPILISIDMLRNDKALDLIKFVSNTEITMNDSKIYFKTNESNQINTYIF